MFMYLPPNIMDVNNLEQPLVTTKLTMPQE